MENFTKTAIALSNRSARLFGVIATVAMLISTYAFAHPVGYSNPAPVPLLTAGTFGALAYSGITGSVNVSGDVGSSTASIGTGITATGTKHIVGDSQTLQAQTDLTAALSNALGRTSDATITAGTLGGLTLFHGVYSYGSALDLASNNTLTLDAQGDPAAVFIIEAGSALTINTGSTVSLIGGAVWSNVFWYVGTSATIHGASSNFNGIILAVSSITLESGSTTTARLLANTGAVTLASPVLPVELVAFSATTNRADAILHWSTATEIDNHGFEVERRQTATWQDVAFVAGTGTSNSPKSYSYTDNNLAAGSYTYRLKQIDNNGAFLYYGSAAVEIKTAPETFALSQNYPNPFNPSTMISYQLPVNSQVSLKVYDVLGNEIASLVNGRQEAGSYAVSFNTNEGTRNLSSGVYFYRLETGSFVSIKKLILMK